jgi:hypothetical protein
VRNYDELYLNIIQEGVAVDRWGVDIAIVSAEMLIIAGGH